jgi:kojibiose phosphorylase
MHTDDPAVGVAAAPAADDPFVPDPDPRWRMEVDGWAPTHEAAVEGALALVNGYLGTRAAVEEGSPASTAATFLGGVFETATEAVAQVASTPELQIVAAPTPELVVAPDWSRIRLAVDGEPLALDTAEVLGQRRTLDLRRGVLLREWRLRAGGRTTRLRSLRFVSLDDRHLLGQALELLPEDWSGQLTVEALVDGDVANEGGVRHLVGHQSRAVDGGLLLETATRERRIAVCLAAAAALRGDDGEELVGEALPQDRAVLHRWQAAAAAGRALRLDKLVAVFTGRDGADPAGAATALLGRAAADGLAAALARSAAAWAARWAVADVTVDGDDELQRRIRFALYHLIGAASPDDPRAAPGARSLTGERYKGHVFWDTETFVLPFYVATHPPTARAVLGYRHHTLPAARSIAAAHGWRGAAYAWESADTGADVTPAWFVTASGEKVVPRTGEQEHHLNADIGFALWQYWQATGDEGFVLGAGAEVLVELARFWAGRAERGDDGGWHVRTVIGPDEYHEGVDDNAYTNQLAGVVLDRAADLADRLRERRPERLAELGVDPAEPAAWRAVAAGLVDGLDPATGLIEQHRGFHDLEPIDLAAFEPRSTTMDVLLGFHRLNDLKLTKQADVVMLLALLGERYPAEVQRANFAYYEPLTAQDSSLSPSIHALVAARLGELDLAERYLWRSTRLDLDLEHGVTAAGGVHIAALGGIWQALVYGFGGMHLTDGAPTFAPHVPAAWGTLRFNVCWRGTLLEVAASGATATVTPRP